MAGPLAGPLDLLDLLPGWEGTAIVVDATRSGAEPGSVSLTYLEKGEQASGLAGELDRPSTHGVGILDVHRLLSSLGVGPERLAVVGVEGSDFSGGEGLSPQVEAAVGKAAALVLRLAAGRQVGSTRTLPTTLASTASWAAATSSRENLWTGSSESAPATSASETHEIAERISSSGTV